MKKLLFFFICLFYSCKLIAQETELILIKSFPDYSSENENNYLANPQDVIFHDNKYFVADGMDSNIKVFSESGEFIKQIGRRGQGPGEFGPVNFLAIDKINNLLYCNDAGNGRISVFTTSGEYQKSIRVLNLNRSIDFSDNVLLTSSINKNTKTNFNMYNSNGELIKKIGDRFQDNLATGRYQNFFYRSDIHNYDNNFYVFYNNIPYVDIYGTNGTLKKRIKINIEFLSEKYKDNIKGLNNGAVQGRIMVNPLFRGASVYNNELFFNVRTKRTEMKIFVTNMEGDLLRTIPFKGGLPLPIRYRLKSVKNAKFVYTDLSAAQVKIYRENKITK